MSQGNAASPAEIASIAELKEQLEFLRAQEVKLQATYTEACKGLTLLNMGAVAAMLAMIQALIGKDVFGPLKYFALSGISVFLLGAIAASTVFFLLMGRIAGSVATTPVPDNALANIPKLLMFSMACFAAGAVAIVIGLAVSY